MNCEVSYEFKLKGEAAESPWSLMALESIHGVPDDLQAADLRDGIEKMILSNSPLIGQVRNLRIV